MALFFQPPCPERSGPLCSQTCWVRGRASGVFMSACVHVCVRVSGRPSRKCAPVFSGLSAALSSIVFYRVLSSLLVRVAAPDHGGDGGSACSSTSDSGDCSGVMVVLAVVLVLAVDAEVRACEIVAMFTRTHTCTHTHTQTHSQFCCWCVRIVHP